MATVLSEQERQALQSAGGQPVQVVDPETQRVYYLIPGEQYERIRALIMEDEFEPRELHPLIAKTAGEAGWNDPIMNDYDRYDEHRSRQSR
jgi:hypothetical protein